MDLVAELTDVEAIARIRAGGDAVHAAFRVIYERHSPEVLRFLLRMLRDEAAAEDALQETFVRLHRGLGGYDPARPLRPYLLSVARNAAIDALRVREKGPRVEPLEAEPALDEEAALKHAVDVEEKSAIDAALASLESEHRAVVLLRFAHGLKLEEVAEALSCTSRTARNRLRAACILLERELRNRGVFRGEVAE